MTMFSDRPMRLRYPFLDLFKRIAVYLNNQFPIFKNILWEFIYNRLVRTLPNRDFVYVNLGYAPLNQHQTLSSEFPKSMQWYSEQLYLHVAAGVSIEDKDVLEIGCGRGGGSAFIASKMKPKTITAIDISSEAISFCKKVHSSYGIHFKKANAEFLEFPTSSFDVVINIESSHCYVSRQRFFINVAKVLRPRGYFLYSDLFNPDQDNLSASQIIGMLQNADFTLVKCEDIRANVFASREALSKCSQTEESLHRWANLDSAKSTLLRSVFCLEGSSGYESLKSGRMEYGFWIAQKNGI